ncbi:MAG: undecaprenyl phosphate translocase family protein, partial [Haloarculaceae archaeon]
MWDPGNRRSAWFGIYLRGVCMGAADAVPGVSGGTIALVTGIYDRLIAAVTAVTPDRVVAVLAAPLPGRRADAREALRAMDARFLVALGAGITTAVVTVTRLLHH